MKKTEWFYEPNSNKWWMVTVATNADNIPTIKLGDRKLTKRNKAIIHNINLADDNKRLWWIILGLCGVLGCMVALSVFLAVA
jgi:hypothetical protein